MASPVPLALIAGGTSGLGFASATRLLERGTDVILTGRNLARGEDARAHLQATAPDRAVAFIPVDHSDFTNFDRIVDALDNRCLSTLVVAAASGLQAHLTDTTPEAFMAMLRLNVCAPLALVQRLLPHFDPGASIILISSDAGIDGEQALGAYSVTKAALNMLGRMLALDLAPQGIRVNVVCPGDTVPGMRHLLRPGDTERSPDDYLQWPIPPRGRWGRAEDTANLVAFLTSREADFMVGTVTLVDGGSRAGRPDRS